MSTINIVMPRLLINDFVFLFIQDGVQYDDRCRSIVRIRKSC